MISHTCDDLTFLPSGKLIARGVSAGRLLTTSTPSMMNIDVAPVLAMACVVAKVIALRESAIGNPAAAIDVGPTETASWGWGKQRNEQFYVGTVASSSSMMFPKNQCVQKLNC